MRIFANDLGFGDNVADLVIDELRQDVRVNCFLVYDRPLARQDIVDGFTGILHLPRRGFVAQVLNTQGLAEVPEIVEIGRNLGGNRARREYIDIVELGVVPQAEVFRGQVASADDGKTAVHGEGLVVHAPVGAREIPRVIQVLEPPASDGIEQAHLDIFMLVQHEQVDVFDAGENVVEQKTHAHAAIRRLQQLCRNQRADDIVLHQEVLQVDTFLGGVDQAQACTEGIAAVSQREKSRLTIGEGVGLLHRMSAEPGALRDRDGKAGFLLNVEIGAGACRQQGQ